MATDDGGAVPVLLPGARAGRYEILEALGRGGMGVLYRARDASLDRDVALKCPARDLSDDEVARERFAREARASARLSHPHIVHVYEVFEQDDQPWLAMQLVRGPSLSKVLAQRGALPIPDVLRWGEQLASALAHAHEHRILHRDIKPGNILIDADGRALLADFGLARTLAPPELGTSRPTPSDSLTWSGAVLGTPAYMSPEQALGGPVDERSDVFSLGAVLYEMCTGHPLIPHGAMRGAFETPGGPEPPSARTVNPTVPADLERIVCKAVAWRPEERHASASALEEELRAFRTKTASASWRRTRAALALGIIALLAVVVVAGLTGRFSRRDAGHERAGGVATAIVTWPSREVEGRVSPDRRWLSFLSNRDGSFRVWLRSLAGSLEQPLTRPDENVESHLWSEDGQEIAYSVDIDEEAFVRIIPALGGPPRTAWSFDARRGDARLIRWIGTRLYLEVESTLVRVELTTRVVTELQVHRPGPIYRQGFDVRKDERRVVYSEGRDQGFALWTSDLDGRNPRRVTSGESLDYGPRWTGHRGDRIVYTSNRSGQIDLWDVDVDDGSTEPITLSPGAEHATDVSADGSLLVFVQSIDTSHLWTLHHETAETHQLTADALGDFWTTTAADLPAVAFERAKPRLGESARSLGVQILLGRVADDRLSDTRPLTANGHEPGLSPDGRRLTYVRGDELWVQDVETGDELLATPEFAWSGLRQFPYAWTNHNVAWTRSGSALYFVTRTQTGMAVIGLQIEPRQGEPETILFGPPDTLIRDVLVSEDATGLLYVAQRPNESELRCRHLPSGQDRVLLTARAGVRPLGWVDENTILVALGTDNPDFTQSIELLAVGMSGQRRRVGSLDRAYVDTATLDARRRTLYVTALTSDNAHNVVALSLADGHHRVLTDNQSPGVTFTAIQVLPDGVLIHARQERSEDIWIVESSRRD